MAEFNISGRLTVKSLKKQFEDSFGLELRVYDGNKFAEGDSTLASISKIKVDDFECRSNMIISNFESKFHDATGIKVQIATLSNAKTEPNELVNNSFTLSEASSKFRPE
jgi:hypothetical protein